MVRWPFSRDFNELVFRVLFSSIFLGLGGEHLLSDQLIQHLMPAWMPAPRVVSILSGVILLFGGSLVLVGWRVHLAAYVLGAFLVVVTLLVHVPAVFTPMPSLPAEHQWLWTVLQRSNLVKNLCLLGVCFQLGYHRVGRYSLSHHLAPPGEPD